MSSTVFFFSIMHKGFTRPLHKFQVCRSRPQIILQRKDRVTLLASEPWNTEPLSYASNRKCILSHSLFTNYLSVVQTADSYIKGAYLCQDRSVPYVFVCMACCPYDGACINETRFYFLRWIIKRRFINFLGIMGALNRGWTVVKPY